ncbi:MAG: glycosidase [Verrucomicrobia bacterium]|nr:glycosidase [Verrucomicrobiota bacterium]
MHTLHPRIQSLLQQQEELYNRVNKPDARWNNGWFDRFVDPVLTKQHVPLSWRYDFNPQTNPLGMERLGVGAVFNAGAIEVDETVYVMARVEGNDRKSFFALASSPTGIDQFRFIDGPVVLPETDDPDINVYDMRLVQHQDGWIYGLFCTERKDPSAPAQDTSSAVAQCGIVRTKDLKHWERLPDFQSPSPQQRNVVLHPEFVNGKYAFYTRPQDGFIDTGKGGGIGWGLSDSMNPARVTHEEIIHSRAYHTVYEVKNGQGPAPLKTPNGWLHIAHGVRNCASGLRYVLYLFLTDLNNPAQLLRVPSGFFIAADFEERIGDLVNVAFCNGVIARQDGTVLIYYASCDTQLHVARTSIDQLVDFALNTPEDPLRTALCAQQRHNLWLSNQQFLSQ